MANNHPITLSEEQINRWLDDEATSLSEQFQEAARIGADQELEACCADLRMVLGPNQANWLRSVRRPKPPSLKEQALAALSEADRGLNESEWQHCSDTIRRALEALPND